MRPVSLALILFGVFLNAAAQLLLKAGATALGPVEWSRTGILTYLLQIATEPHIQMGLGCYGISVILWVLALSRVPVSIAYPMLSIGYVVNACAAWYLFGETLSVGRWLGIGLVVIGVVLIAKP